MAERLTINLPEIAFTGTGASALAAKRALDPNDFRPVGVSPFTELKIVGFRSWRQSPFLVPAGYYGDITFAVDPGGRYCLESGFPAIEDSLPRYLKFLGATIIDPTTLRLPEPFEFSDPVMWRAGDKIIVAPENNNAGSQAFSHFAGLTIESETGDFPLDDGIVWMMPMNGVGNDGGTAWTRRSLIPANPLTVGTKVQVHFAYSGGSVISADVGISAGSGNMVATPVPALVGGSTSFTPPVGGVWSDPATLTTAGQALVVGIRSSGLFPFKNVGPASAPSWGTQTDSHSSATLLGTVSGAPTRGYWVDAVKVIA